jgi:alpha-L-fucosidase 2
VLGGEFAKTPLYALIQEQRELLKPYKIGKNGYLGHLLEWFEQEDDDFDNSKVEKKHRHISHLLGLYPGNSINKKTPELMAAAVAVMEERGNGSTGWSRAFKANLWARVGDGERAYECLRGLVNDCTYENLFSFHPPFQIDGNLGGAAAVAEMLIQSHNGYIEVFPAVPKVWANVSFKGLCARGGFTVDASLSKGIVVNMSVYSKKGGICRIKKGDEIIEISTVAGGVYNV